MSRVILMPSKGIGLNIAKFLKKNGDSISSLFLTDEDEEYNNKVIKITKTPKNQIYIGKKLHNDSEIVEQLPPFDFIVTVYWPYLLKPIIINKSLKGSVNFHPALLPTNRGWYPHVHSLLDGTPFGVTLHAMDEGADTGPIWVQKELKVDICMDAGQIHSFLQNKMELLFIENWHKISNGLIQPLPQDESKAIYRSKNEIDNLDEIDMNNSMKIRDFVNFLKARSFKNRGFSYFINNDEKIYLQIKLNRTGVFDE